MPPNRPFVQRETVETFEDAMAPSEEKVEKLQRDTAAADFARREAERAVDEYADVLGQIDLSRVDFYSTEMEADRRLAFCTYWGDGGKYHSPEGPFLHFDRLDGAAVVVSEPRFEHFSRPCMASVVRHELCHLGDLFENGLHDGEDSDLFISRCKAARAPHEALDTPYSRLLRRNEREFLKEHGGPLALFKAMLT